MNASELNGPQLSKCGDARPAANSSALRRSRDRAQNCNAGSALAASPSERRADASPVNFRLFERPVPVMARLCKKGTVRGPSETRPTANSTQLRCASARDSLLNSSSRGRLAACCLSRRAAPDPDRTFTGTPRSTALRKGANKIPSYSDSPMEKPHGACCLINSSTSEDARLQINSN
jgi:hypothetical protein